MRTTPFRKLHWSAAGGSSLQGYVNASINELEQLLGTPSMTDIDSGDGKVCHLWAVEYKGLVFTIYDYKGCLASGDRRKEWHVGGTNAFAVNAAKEVLAL